MLIRIALRLSDSDQLSDSREALRAQERARAPRHDASRAACLTAIRAAITIACMDQLDLFHHASFAADGPTARRRARASTAAAEHTRSSGTPVVVLEHDLVPGLHQDPDLARLQTRALEFVRQARAGATRKAYSNDWMLFEAWCVQHGEQQLPASVQRATKRADLEGDFSAHSLRAGLATSASAHGHALRTIQEHVGWLDARTPARYIVGVLGGAGDVLSGLL